MMSEISLIMHFLRIYAGFQRGGGGGGQGVWTSMKNHKSIAFLSNTGPDPLKNHKATKPAFTSGQSLALYGVLLAGQ